MSNNFLHPVSLIFLEPRECLLAVKNEIVEFFYLKLCNVLGILKIFENYNKLELGY